VLNFYASQHSYNGLIHMMRPLSFFSKHLLALLLVVFLLFAASLPVSADETPPVPETTASETASLTLEPSVTPESSATPEPSATPESSTTPTPEPSVTPEKQAWVEIVVRLRPGANRQQGVRRLGNYGKVAAENALSQSLGAYVLQVPSEQASQILVELNQSPDFLYAEPNHILAAQEVIPNDPAWGLQYNMLAIRAPQGWVYSTGSSAVTIAIVDSGVDMTHPDLLGKIVAGYNFVTSEEDEKNNPSDDYGHGTHVAGLAAAFGNNGIGMAGTSWGARIMPVKVLNSSGLGTYANAAAGIVWAADQGARVINLSFGGSAPSSVLEDAVNYAAARGIVLVGAAGNNGSPSVLYPAAYPAVIAVSATNSSNQRAIFSNYGPQIELAAPGAGIYSLHLGGGYMTRNGTSMSAPQVSGLAAILLGLPGNASASAVRSQMQASALDLGPAGWDSEFGFGLIQMDAAILLAPTLTPTPTLEAKSPTPAGLGWGIYFPPASLTPTATPTLTVTLLPESGLLTVAPEMTATPTLLAALPVPTGIEAAGMDDLLLERDNDLLCWGSSALLAGIFLLLVMRKLKKEKR
jgi:thermitase